VAVAKHCDTTFLPIVRVEHNGASAARNGAAPKEGKGVCAPWECLIGARQVAGLQAPAAIDEGGAERGQRAVPERARMRPARGLPPPARLGLAQQFSVSGGSQIKGAVRVVVEDVVIWHG